MTLYENVFDALGLSPVARDFSLGRLPLPSLSLYTPFPAAGFPPALVPIWVSPTGLEYFGYWKHFFTQRHEVPRRFYIAGDGSRRGCGIAEPHDGVPGY